VQLSVIIVSFNSGGCIRACVESVRKQLPAAEVIAIDNASDDDSVSILSSFQDVRVLRSAENVGFGRACNLGVEAAQGTHLLFLNPDVVVTGVDEQGLERLYEDGPFGLVGPALRRTDGRGKRVDAGNAESHWLQDYLANTWLTLWPREFPLSGSGRKAPRSPDWVSGAMLLARTAEFRRLGGFDPRFFLYYEDRDLCARYRRAGLPIARSTALVGQHVGSSSTQGDELVVEPLTWCYLGWLEYLYLHEGDRTARRAARLSLDTLRFLRASLRLVRRGAPASARLERKSRQLTGLLSSLRRRVQNEDPSGYCPDAQRVLGEAWNARGRR
jgi:N-acetylglucosaminyl-diphospho-decaprenol L-rhamnosyltransferase